MAQEEKERRIGATTYRIKQLPAKKGRALLVRFVRLVGPGAGALVGGAGRANASGNVNANAVIGIAVGDALDDLCTRLNEDDLSVMCDAFAEYTVVVLSQDIEKRLSNIFDEHFAGRYDEMLQWLRACCEVNFASFFGGLIAGGRLGAIMDLVSKLQSLRESTGTSTVSPAASTTPTPS